MQHVLRVIGDSPPMTVVLFFVAAYPMGSGAMWIVTSLVFWFQRERGGRGDDDEWFYDIPDHELPRISVLVPAYNEESVLVATLDALHAVDYPDLEVVVVDDASTDRTNEIARAHAVRDRRFHVLTKLQNEGKAMAMNDAMPLLTGEIVVVVDADACIRRAALRALAAHFVRLPRVGAVTGNPRVTNANGFVTEMQALEFTSIVSILRRAQVVWGRVLTVSGVISAFRKSALLDVGMFDPSMATEDIDVTWRLQRRFYDVRYEPRALIDMVVPETVGALWRQRRRWATGLAQVLRRHSDLLLHWKNRRHWPVLIEAILSVLWAHVLVTLAAFWALCAVSGVPARGASPFPNGWGMLIATVCMIQLCTGVWLDRRYDHTIVRSLRLAPLYPLGYWLFAAMVTMRSTLPALLARRPEVSQWHTVREPVSTSRAA